MYLLFYPKLFCSIWCDWWQIGAKKIKIGAKDQAYKTVTNRNIKSLQPNIYLLIYLYYI